MRFSLPQVLLPNWITVSYNALPHMVYVSRPYFVINIFSSWVMHFPSLALGGLQSDCTHYLCLKRGTGFRMVLFWDRKCVWGWGGGGGREVLRTLVTHVIGKCAGALMQSSAVHVPFLLRFAAPGAEGLRLKKLKSPMLWFAQGAVTVIAEDLRLCTVKPVRDADRRFVFEVVTPYR